MAQVQFALGWPSKQEELISIKKSKIKSQTISSLFDLEEGIQGLENQLKLICKQSELSIKEGCSLIIISDKGINPKKTFIPPFTCCWRNSSLSS